MPEFLAFTLEQAAELGGLTVRQLKYWDDTGFFNASIRNVHGRPYGRIYSFRDVVGLRTLAQLRNKYEIPLQKLRPAGEWLKQRYDAPWSELRIYVSGQEIYFRDQDIQQYRLGSRPEQTAVPIKLEEVATATQAEAARMSERSKEEHGLIDRHRYVSHNKWFIRGTRIRTEAIWNFHQAGYSTGEILKQYPRLVASDVAAAIEFERGEREQHVG